MATEIKKKPKVMGMSADEQEHWEHAKYDHDAPMRQATRAIQGGVDIVLQALGVNTDVDDYTLQAQMQSLGIFIQSYDNEPNVAPQLQGLYIFQMGYKSLVDIKPTPREIAFIGNPFVNSVGEINVAIHWFAKDVMDVIKGGRVN